MTNNFYNVNIHRYNPTEHAYNGNISNSDEDVQNILDNQAISDVRNIVESSHQSEPSSHSRLNALDSKILVDEAYQNIDDEVFRKEYQINKLEESLKVIEKDIEQAKAINDLQKVDVLVMRKHSIQAKLAQLNEEYGRSDVTTRLSGGLTSILQVKPNLLSQVVDSCVGFIENKVLPKISKKYNSGLDIKNALSKLETLNKNVDEIVTSQMPYGEADERYDMLTNYLNTANVIHFNISKTIGTPTFFDTISSIDKEKYHEMSKKNKSNFGGMTGNPQPDIPQ